MKIRKLKVQGVEIILLKGEELEIGYRACASRQEFFTFSVSLRPLSSLVKPVDPFFGKHFEIHK